MQIPATHLPLVDGLYCATLTTMTADGYPQSTPVWCNRDGDDILINSMDSFAKIKHMQRNPKVTLLIYDPANPLYNIEIRGEVVEMTEIGAIEHNDQLAALYLNKPNAKFFGDVIPASFGETYRPIKTRIRPNRIRVEGAP